jgi:hypothetical protein
MAVGKSLEKVAPRFIQRMKPEPCVRTSPARIRTPFGLVYALLALCTIGMQDSQPARASDDHGGAKAINVSPRLEARFDDQQLVLVYANRQLYEDKPLLSFNNKQVVKFGDPRLVLFLENYVTGVPTIGAEIDLTLNFLPHTLKETAPGVYQTEKLILGGGRNEVELSYKIGAKEGDLTLMLVIPAGATSLANSVASSIPPPTVPGWVYALGGLAIYLLVTAVFWRRGNRAA